MHSTFPLRALVAFDAAMKHKSFRLAAQELHVTPGAVGQQVQKLEDWFGSPLFIRSIRQIQPTADALDYWAAVRPALARIQEVSDRMRLSQAHEVRLSMPPSLAAKWFAPRMAGFLAARPDATLHLSASSVLIDFERDHVDLAIRYFDGRDATLETALLYRDEARLYCSPAYARKLKLKTPDDLLRATLLHTTLLPHWRAWMQRFSTLDQARIDTLKGLHFDQAMLAIEAARHGHGVVLSSAILTEAEVREGSLYEPFELRLPVPRGYYLVHRPGAVLRPAAQALKQWLLGLTEPRAL